MANRQNISGGAVELLEGRRLLAGDVVVTIQDGNLAIFGDARANDIVVDMVGLNEGQVRIASGSDLTSINGQEGPVILAAFTGDLVASMREGPDRLVLRDLALPGHLRVQTGLGMDSVSLFGVTVAGDTALRTGVRADSIEIDDSTFSGSVLVNMRWGADALRIEQSGDAEGVRSFFNGPVQVRMSRGDDDMRVGLDANTGNRAVFYGDLACDGGVGEDQLINGDGNWFDFAPVVTNFEFNGIVLVA